MAQELLVHVKIAMMDSRVLNRIRIFYTSVNHTEMLLVGTEAGGSSWRGRMLASILVIATLDIVLLGLLRLTSTAIP